VAFNEDIKECGDFSGYDLEILRIFYFHKTYLSLYQWLYKPLECNVAIVTSNINLH
jgi:hypothetical protein